MEEMIRNVKLNLDKYPGQDLYSDGSVEDRLLEIVKNNSEDNLEEIINENSSWPIIYHLSNTRKNIIEWYDFEEDAKILEIGAGCGAITGALANKASKVDCVELSKKRSSINAYRNGNFDNIEIFVGNFQDIEPTLESDYDYITLIGVLEYAAMYISGNNPYVEFLNIIKKHLKKDGKIIIAIENKYGLKYWAGCKEDHVSAFFEGLEGYTNTSGVETFSRDGLDNTLKQAGLDVEGWYYPYPDYKLPKVVYSDYFLPKVGELNNNMVHLDNDRLMLFDEAKVFDNLIADGKFKEFSNSFLVICKEN